LRSRENSNPIKIKDFGVHISICPKLIHPIGGPDPAAYCDNNGFLADTEPNVGDTIRMTVSYAWGSAPADPAQSSLPAYCETGRPVLRRVVYIIHSM